MVFYILVLQFYWKNWQKIEDDNFLRKKTENICNICNICNTTVISVDGKGTVFPVMLKLQWGIVWIKVLKKRILKKI